MESIGFVCEGEQENRKLDAERDNYVEIHRRIEDILSEAKKNSGTKVNHDIQERRGNGIDWNGFEIK